MHVRIIHQYFRTPEEGGGLRTWYMGKYLISRGYEVSIITGGNKSGYHRRTIDGMDVHYLPIYYSNHLGFLSRLHAFWLFVQKSVHLLTTLPAADIHYILTTPLTTGLIGIRAKRKLRIPYIFEIGDIWPEAPKQLKVLTNPLGLWLAEMLERKSYQEAEALVGLSPEISQYLREKASGKPVYTIPNISETSFFRLSEKLPDVRPNKFVISYIGTLGQANHLEYLINAARHFPDASGVKVVIMGDGAQAASLKKLVTPNDPIRFLPHGGREEVKKVMEESDAVYISFKDVPVLSSGSPNKFFDGLAAGKLIILNFKGWIKNLIEEKKCGIYHQPEHPESLWIGLKPFLEDPKLLLSYQKRSRKLAEESFAKEKVFEELDKLLKELS